MDFLYMFRMHVKYAEKERLKIMAYTMLHSVSVMATLAKPMTFAMAVNSIQKQKEEMVSEVLFWLMMYALCFFMFELFHVSARFIELNVAYHNRERFILSTYDILQSLPLEWHVNHHSGNVISRVNKAADALFAFGQSVYDYITVIVNFIGATILLWLISPVLAIASIVVGLFTVRVTRWIYNRTVPEYRMFNEGLHRIAETLQDGISNITTIIILRLGNCIQSDLKDKFHKNYPHMVREQKLTQVKCVTNGLVITLLHVTLILYYVVDCRKSGAVILIGFVTAIFQYLDQLMSAFEFYFSDYENVIHWRADVEAADPVLVEAETFTTVLQKDKVSIVNPKWSDIIIGPIHFTYGGNHLHLQDVTVRIKLANKIAFVGESGSGKSTLLKIIRGLYPVSGCNMTIDQKETVSIDALSSITTLIPQEAEIFDNDIRYNITMGLPATEDEIREAIWLSRFEEVRKRLPNGLESGVSEKGVNLSGGEKQRLALARGIFSIKDSDIVLLDEPTGSLDAATELEIFKRLWERFKDRCIISALHRLHLLRMFDYIYVFKDGKIVEEGKFEELLGNKAYFSYLWSRYEFDKEDALGAPNS